MEAEAIVLRAKKRLSNVVEEIADLEARLLAARARAAAFREILGDGSEGSSESSQGRIAPDSTVGKVIGILKESGSPMHLNAILDQLGIPVTTKTKRGVSTQLNTYYRQGRLFSRPQPNTYWLLDEA